MWLTGWHRYIVFWDGAWEHDDCVALDLQSEMQDRTNPCHVTTRGVHARVGGLQLHVSSRVQVSRCMP